MKRNQHFQNLKKIIKNHPVKFGAGGVGGATFLVGMGKIIFTLEYKDIIQCVSVIKNVLTDNIAIIVIGIIIVSTYVYKYKSKKLKSNELTYQKTIKCVDDALSKNTNIKSVEIHGNEEEWSLSIDTQGKEESTNNNMYVLKNPKKRNQQ
ncbi:MAG: hypothetical protein NC420_03980 [Eubacterium sp.]|nr:hypothetical protein [Eubacterium sp.]